MSKVKVLCTSTGSIEYAPERYQNLGIDFFRIHMRFKDKEYLEGPELDPVKFYEELEVLEDAKHNLPKTAIPSPMEFAAPIEKAIEEGYDEIIAFTISSGISGAYSALCAIAEDYKDRIKINVVDTKVASFPEGYHAVRAVEMLNAGRSVDEILAETKWAIEHQEFIAVDGKLDYLIYNGRLKGAKAFMGQMLKICPLVHFDEKGDLVAVESIRTSKKALARMCEILSEKIAGRDPKDYLLYHVYTGTSLIEPLKEIEKKYGIETNHEPVIMNPTSGCHNGPWLAGYGLYFFRREDETL